FRVGGPTGPLCSSESVGDTGLSGVRGTAPDADIVYAVASKRQTISPPSPFPFLVPRVAALWRAATGEVEAETEPARVLTATATKYNYADLSPAPVVLTSNAFAVGYLVVPVNS